MNRFYINVTHEFEKIVSERFDEINKTGTYTGSYPDIVFRLDELEEYTKEFLEDVNGALVVTPFYLMSDTFNFYIGVNQDSAGANNCIEVIECCLPIRKLAGMTIPDLGNYIFGIWNAYVNLKPEKKHA